MVNPTMCSSTMLISTGASPRFGAAMPVTNREMANKVSAEM